MTTNGFLAVPQLGRVLIEDDVRVGANTTIDRGSARDTVIGAGIWIDNLVQIGHNVTIGRHCIIVAQVGIAGSTTIGDFVRIGGQAAISGHLIIGDYAGIGGQTGVIGNVAADAEVMGTPAQPKREFLRQIAGLRKSTSARSLRPSNDVRHVASGQDSPFCRRQGKRTAFLRVAGRSHAGQGIATHRPDLGCYHDVGAFLRSRSC